MAASPDASVFFISDQTTGRHFLVDTGACKSLFPVNQVNDPGRKGDYMRAANGSRINTYGTVNLTIRTASQLYKWPFIVADVSFPILGAGFLGPTTSSSTPDAK